jgi:lipoate-protein ligase B
MENRIVDLGLVEYVQALGFQKEIFGEVKNGSLKSALIFCRHYPVFTLGRQAKNENLKVSRDLLSGRGIPVHHVERGGDITYHGPGQLVVYPVLNLDLFKRDLHYFLRKLESTVIGVLSEFGINGSSRKDLTGVWVGRSKISSIGIAVKNWISFHGLALNVKKDDLGNFSLIRPCGMDIEMVSMETILGREISFSDVQKTFIRRFTDE